MPKSDVNPKLFNVLVVKQIAGMLGNIIDSLTRLAECEKERFQHEQEHQAYMEGFCRDILAECEKCAETIESLDKESKP